MPWPIYLALKQLFPTGKRVHFFTVISIAGVSLGVMMLIVTISVMGGFGREIRRMIIDTGGDIQIRSSAAIRDPELVLKDVLAVTGVAAATPYAEGVVMVLSGNRPAFPAVQGVDVERVGKVIPIDRYIRRGSLDALDDDSIILSGQLAQQLDATIGSKIELYTPLMLERMRADEAILPREFRVAGLFEIGHN
ncbi:MAG TPA: ABC transporter permease, partial [Opitutaceae bacterium]|nr:ABC transporter permease [Opitutaceae bacterium]